jgi:hypothetical protein
MQLLYKDAPVYRVYGAMAASTLNMAQTAQLWQDTVHATVFSWLENELKKACAAQRVSGLACDPLRSAVDQVSTPVHRIRCSQLVIQARSLLVP